MKAAKQIRAYLDAMNKAGVGAQKVCGWEETAITRDDLEQVLARLDGYKDLRRQVQKTQAMRTELASALQVSPPSPFVARWRDLLTIAREMQKALAEERAERARLASQLAAAENTLQQTQNRINDVWAVFLTHQSKPFLLQDQVKVIGDQFSELAADLQLRDVTAKYRTLRQALREVCEAVLPLYKDRDPGQQLSALQAQLEQREELIKMLDETFAAIKNLYRELGGDPAKLPVNNGPQMLAYLGTRISHSQDINVEPDRRELRALKGRIRDAYYGYFGYPEDNSRNEHNPQAMLQILRENLQRLSGNALSEPAIAARVNQALSGVQSKLRDTLAERDQAQEKLAQIARIATPEDLPF